jgi:hypothetical protein
LSGVHHITAFPATSTKLLLTQQIHLITEVHFPFEFGSCI